MKDKRDTPPTGYTAEEYGKVIYERLPMSRLTRKESYCLKCYIDSLKENLSSFDLERAQWLHEERFKYIEKGMSKE